MAKLLTYEGECREVEPKNGTDFSLEELRELIGCEYIEVVRYFNDEDLIMIVDEEGRIKPSASNTLNVLATLECAHSYIFGNAVVCNINQLK